MTDQERMQQAFDQAWHGLARQGFERSGPTDAAGPCRYRSEDGRKCAIGWLIPDHLYDPRMEGLPGSAVVNRSAVPLIPEASLGTTMYHFVARLQMAHDDGVTPDRMKRNLTTVAEQYELAIPEEE